MPLRCLLFSSNENVVQPIWQVLADLGIEGEYCPNAVDAVEKVTTQLFQIVITDWEDQPEATFLLKTARDQKAAQRPLTLAIVNDESKLPEALQAGANSVLVKPLRVEEVRDTMSTACELLRSKVSFSAATAAPPPPALKTSTEKPEKSVAAAPGVGQSPENAFRAGEFLQSSGSGPSAQFDTECEVQKSLEETTEVDSLAELEPTAAAVAEPKPELVDPRDALTGWAALQARLTKPIFQADAPAPPKSELLASEETPSYGASAPKLDKTERIASKQPPALSESEAALFSYMEGESKDRPTAAKPRRIKTIFLSTAAIVCLAIIAVPRVRHGAEIVSRNTWRAGSAWLNPQLAPRVPSATQHDSFGQEGDEYKLPVAENIPDATTDPSQIRVLPVIDPTAKLPKTDKNSVQGSEDTTAKDVNQNDPQTDGVPTPGGESQGKDQIMAGLGNASVAPSAVISPPVEPTATSPTMEGTIGGPVPQPTPHTIVSPVRSLAPHEISQGNSPGIPSSLRSQTASMTPQASGAKPVEAAMSSIEPVILPESVMWGLLVQQADPVYPGPAKAGGQSGIVVLLVLIGRDGTVQDAKFMEGSLMFARAAIDAVRQWRFKPYTMNARAVSVQGLITLNFKPPK